MQHKIIFFSITFSPCENQIVQKVWLWEDAILFWILYITSLKAKKWGPFEP